MTAKPSHDRYLILGMGSSGEAVRTYCQQKSIPYLCVDRKGGHGILSDQQHPNLDSISHLIKSPGVPPHHPWVQEAQHRGMPILSEVDLALPYFRNKYVIAVTGTNGKTTTVSALGQVLGERAVVGGNIGTPALHLIHHPAPIVVLELSSFQLDTLQPGPWFDAGVILNVTLNHLDYHGTFAAYQQAKQRLREEIKPLGFFLTDSERGSLEEKIETFFLPDYRMDGRSLYPHDRSNFATVWAFCRQIGMSDDEFAKKIVAVKKPPHRLEEVGIWGGVRIVNDSKSTTIDSTKQALSSLSGPLYLLAGGMHKGGDFQEWMALCKEKVSMLISYGRDSSAIQTALAQHVHCVQRCTLQEAFEHALQQIKSGDTLLLSPGCASLDQFRNYEERGEYFVRLVKERMGKGYESS